MPFTGAEAGRPHCWLAHEYPRSALRYLPIGYAAGTNHLARKAVSGLVNAPQRIFGTLVTCHSAMIASGQPSGVPSLIAHGAQT